MTTLYQLQKLGVVICEKMPKNNLLRQADFWYVTLGLSTYQLAKIQHDTFLFHVKAIF